MVLAYLIYDLKSGAIMQRLTCNAGLDRKAHMNLAEGRGAIIAPSWAEGIPEDHIVKDGILVKKDKTND